MFISLQILPALIALFESKPHTLWKKKKYTNG